MPDFLVFQLYGPLASWGDIAVGEYRPSARYPSKSAIMGLIAAALGIKRSEEEKHIQLNQSFKFAVCASFGDKMQDYHTSQVPSGKRSYCTRRDELHLSDKIETVLSQRDYYTDSFYKIALWMENDKFFSLNQIKEALKCPQFVLYLGRKSCTLSLPTNPDISQDKSLKDAFDSFNDDCSIKKMIKINSKYYYWEYGLDENELGMSPEKMYSRRDRVESRRRWQFSNRDEFYYFEGENKRG